jgi:thymidylate synthase
MHLRTRNVNTAFRELVRVFRDGGCDRNSADDYMTAVVRQPSRNGDVLVIDEPVLVTYAHPRERVLFNAARDANPFFHLYESLWMLAGRNDVAPLAYYCKQFKEYSDDGRTLNGAYGYRWRRATADVGDMTGVLDGQEKVRVMEKINVDQLNVLVHHLRAEPTSRRAVLQMWTVEDDLLKIGTKPRDYSDNRPGLLVESPGVDPTHTGYYDHAPASKDVCCNLSVMFSLRMLHLGSRTDRRRGIQPPRDVHYLDMTVTNRSNDLLWGLLGANYVHFTVLQEYLAARLGVEVGLYHHFTNNLHVYKDRKDWRPEELLAEYAAPDDDPRRYKDLTTVSLVHDPDTFEAELPAIVHNNDGRPRPHRLSYVERFFRTVAQPMFDAYHAHKDKNHETAMRFVDEVAADDWRIAATEWLERRANRVRG